MWASLASTALSAFGKKKSGGGGMIKGGDVGVSVGGLNINQRPDESELWGIVAIVAVVAVGMVLIVKVWKG